MYNIMCDISLHRCEN